MRLENSIKNIIISLICNLITIIISFISQNVLINTLGIEYSGLNGVFSNVISMLAILELGLGSQIIYHLYKPIAENDIKRIKQLMNFYKKCYNVIAITMLLIGLLIMPFVKSFIGSNNISENIYCVYLLFLADSVISYLIAYKRSILYANQKNRYVDLVHILYMLLMNGMQIVVLLTTKNYILYLIIKIVCRFLENVLINILANKMYPEAMKHKEEKLDKDTIKDIKKRVKALILHRIGSYVVLSTDTIIISKFLGLAISGIYANYILVIDAANTLLSRIFTAVTGSVGNLLVENNKEKSYSIYKKMTFVNFWIFGLAAIGMAFTINPLIKIWIGNEYIVSDAIACIFALNFYCQGMRRTMETFSSAAGICYENRFVPIIESIVNIIVSIVLVTAMGLPGVIIGTIISTLVLHLYGFPKYMYKPLFNKKRIGYIKEFFYYIIILIIPFILIFWTLEFIQISNDIINLAIRIIICLVIVNIFFYITFRKSDEFKYSINTIKSIIAKRQSNVERNDE